MEPEHPLIQQFLKNWLAEFGRAMEMFTGQQPSLNYNMTDSVSIPKGAPALWLKQVFSTGSSFEIWIGAQEATWMQLGKALGDGPPESLRSTYLEIVNQVQQGAASLTSEGLPSAIRCGNPETLTVARFDPSSFFICDLELLGAENPPLVIAVERIARKVLDTTPSARPEAESPEPGQAVFRSSDLRRVSEISLPVSVSIASTKLEISRILQARPGSVISLAKDAGDLMELLVDGVIVARGELVLVKGNYGFRIKQIVSQHQRISLCSS